VLSKWPRDLAIRTFATSPTEASSGTFPADYKGERKLTIKRRVYHRNKGNAN